MTTVKHVLDQKGHDVHFIHPDATVFDALKMMAENNIGSLVVLEDDKLVGVITERHYAREIVLKGRTSSGTLVRDIMSTKVICARPDQAVEECTAVMTAKGVRHLPVLERGRLVGIISIGDMVKSVIGDQSSLSNSSSISSMATGDPIMTDQRLADIVKDQETLVLVERETVQQACRCM